MVTYTKTFTCDVIIKDKIYTPYVKSDYMFRLCYKDDSGGYSAWDFPGKTFTPSGGEVSQAVQARLGGYPRIEKMSIKKKTIKISGMMWQRDEFNFVQQHKQFIMVFARTRSYSHATVRWRKWDTSNFNNSENHPSTYNLANFYEHGDKVYIDVSPSEDASLSSNIAPDIWPTEKTDEKEIRKFDLTLVLVEN